MITPEFLSYQLDTLTVQKELEKSILSDIARRIVKTDFTVTDTAEWQTEKLQQSGLLFDDIIKQLAKKTDKSKAEIRQIYEQSETELFNYAEEDIGADAELASKPMSPQMRKLWTASLKKTVTEAENLTQTTAALSQSAYIQACDLAHMQILSGAFTYQQAIRGAIAFSVKQGVNVLYPSGHISKLDVAVRRAVLTGVNQTCGKLQDMRADEMGCDLMELSAHAGARPSHAEWQGQIVSRSGKPGYLSLDDIGYGAADGFMGINCRHNWYMYFGGARANSPELLDEYKNHTVTYNGEELTDYEASQKQRRMERTVRLQKQHLTALNSAIKETGSEELKSELRGEFERVSVKLKQKESKLRDFCAQTGRREDTFRTQVYGFDKSVSAKAVWGNKKAVANSGNSGIISVRSDTVALENQRYGRNKSTLVNKTYIESGEYRRKFDNISNNPDVNRTIYNKAKEMLKHRSGTVFEDMYWIDGNNGKIVAREVSSQIERGIYYSEATQKAVSSYKGKNLLAIHTHPGSMPPSAADFNSCCRNGYKTGYIACHNGKVYAYTSKENINEQMYNMYTERFIKEGYAEIDSQLKAIAKLKENYNIDFWEVT